MIKTKKRLPSNLILSPMKEAILKALAHYKYLTVHHLLALGISKSADKCRKYCRELRTTRWLTNRQVSYGLSHYAHQQKTAHKIRYGDLHCLSPKGAKFLEMNTDLSCIRFPRKPKPSLSNDYLHRISTISIHIAFDKRLVKHQALHRRCLLYYDYSRGEDSQKRKKFETETCLHLLNGKKFAPDMLWAYQLPGHLPIVFWLEVYNGDRIKYASEQLTTLFKIIDTSRLIEQKVGVSAVPRILCVCNNEKLLVGIQNRLRKHPYFQVEHIEQLLFFNLDRVVWEDFWKGWVNLFGEVVDLENILNVSYE